MDGAVGGCKKVVMGDFSKSTFLELAVHYCDTQPSKRRRSRGISTRRFPEHWQNSRISWVQELQKPT